MAFSGDRLCCHWFESHLFPVTFVLGVVVWLPDVGMLAEQHLPQTGFLPRGFAWLMP